MPIGGLDVLGDGLFELPGAAVNAPPELLLRESREPALDQIDPGRAGGREVDLEAWMPGEPPMNQGRLVRAVVVQDVVHRQARRHGRVQRLEERAKLAGAMPVVELANDFPRR